MNRRVFLGFVAVQALLALLIFRGALWGDRLLAPLDTAPALLSKYRWLDPQSTGIPANHYTIDQLTYDLPLQHTIYHAYRRGEVPWWDPLTYGGRPLLADAHINGTDPVRLLCYALLPFEAAYNWTLVLHWMLCGLGMFTLLRWWRFPASTSGGLALALACAGYHAVMFGHPWNTGSFLYYPFLWLAWDAWCSSTRRWAWPLATLALASIFYSGNLQSHAYVVVFALVFLLAQCGGSWPAWRRVFPMVALSGILGAGLAAPVLAGQLEFYAHSIRPVPVPMNPVSWFSGLASLTAFHPWALGTFRTLDLSKFLGQYALGFVVFTGSIATALAVLGALRKPSAGPRPAHVRVALGLVLAYFIILSTPLQGALYVRSAGLAVLGLIVLAAAGLEHLRTTDTPLRRWALAWGGLAVTTAIALNIAAFILYPRVMPRILDQVLARGSQQTSLDLAPALREFQVRNLPNEISARNPETLFATAGLLAFAALCSRPGWRRLPGVWPALLALNLVPVALFYARFIPNQPLESWHRLLAGGPEQQQVAAALGNRPFRLYEDAPSIYDQLFPNCLGHLHGVRVMHGYSALIPPCPLHLPPDQRQALPDLLGDATYRSTVRGATSGTFTPPPASGPPRSFRWTGETPRPFRFDHLGLTTQRLVIEAPAPTGVLEWTDTAYPGWRATFEGGQIPIRAAAPCFSALEIPVSRGEATLTLRYRPRWLTHGQLLAASGALALLVLTFFPRRSTEA